MPRDLFRILVIEDNPGDARLISALLSVAKTARFEVETESTLHAGVERAQRENFDAVLLDPGLPDSQGLETIVHFQSQVQGVPVIVLSGFGDEQLGLRAVQEGAQDYLIKGEVETDVLERSIRYALERKRSEDAIRRNTEELRSKELLLRKLLDIMERERQLISYEIHDGFVQDVVGAQMLLESLDYKISASGDTYHEAFQKVREVLQRAINEGRRMISELRPLIIDEQGIIQAVNYLVGEEESKGELEIHFKHNVRFDRLARLLEGTIFRIIQEALTNVKRHSQSRDAYVQIMQVGEEVHIEIRDHGIGFDQSKIPEERFGIRGIQERAHLFGGKASIQSTPGKGTRILAVLPLSDDEESIPN